MYLGGDGKASLRFTDPEDVILALHLSSDYMRPDPGQCVEGFSWYTYYTPDEPLPVRVSDAIDNKTVVIPFGVNCR